MHLVVDHKTTHYKSIIRSCAKNAGADPGGGGGGYWGSNPIDSYDPMTSSCFDGAKHGLLRYIQEGFLFPLC